MDLLQSYLHFRKTGDMRPFLEEMTRQIIVPFVRQRYRFLHKLIGCQPIDRQPGGEKLKEYCAELLSFLYLQIVQSGFFVRFSLENQNEDFKSYLSAILYNAIKESRYNLFFNRFATIFASGENHYYYWIWPEMKRNLDAHQPPRLRNYYLAEWNPIPELFTDRLSRALGGTGFKTWNYVHDRELKNLADEGFSRTIKSLKIKHFMDFLLEIGFIKPDIQSPSEENSFDELLCSDLIENFYKSLTNKEKLYLSLFAYTFQNAKDNNAHQDYFRCAAEFAQQQNIIKISKNTLRNHLIDRKNGIFRRFELLYGTIDEHMGKCFSNLLIFSAQCYPDIVAKMSKH